MFDSFRGRVRSIAALGLAAALAVGGVAVAQSGSGEDGKTSKPRHGKRMPPPPMAPGGPMAKNLTYAEFHVQRKGEEEVLRLDRGEIVSVGDSSITLRANDDSEVTIAIDDDTKVFAGPGRDREVSDLEAGQQVLVSGPKGGAAKAVLVPPKRGKAPRGPAGGKGYGHLPPPPHGGPPQMRG